MPTGRKIRFVTERVNDYLRERILRVFNHGGPVARGSVSPPSLVATENSIWARSGGGQL
jgi:hypothetical protein